MFDNFIFHSNIIKLIHEFENLYGKIFKPG
jgi:hypothetical protein